MDYQDQTVGDLLSDIASERVAPAGGTATAVVGGIGAALCEMGCIHALDADANARTGADLAAARDDLGRQRAHLLRLAASDAAVVEDLFGAASDGVDESDRKRSVGVPLTIAGACLNVLELATTVTADGARSAVVDAATGVYLVHAALRASTYTVRQNLDGVADTEFVAAVEQDVARVEERGEAAADTAMENVERRL